jgi:hypothetical protein
MGCEVPPALMSYQPSTTEEHQQPCRNRCHQCHHTGMNRLWHSWLMYPSLQATVMVASRGCLGLLVNCIVSPDPSPVQHCMVMAKYHAGPNEGAGGGGGSWQMNACRQKPAEHEARAAAGPQQCIRSVLIVIVTSGCCSPLNCTHHLAVGQHWSNQVTLVENNPHWHAP